MRTAVMQQLTQDEAIPGVTPQVKLHSFIHYVANAKVDR